MTRHTAPSDSASEELYTGAELRPGYIIAIAHCTLSGASPAMLNKLGGLSSSSSQKVGSVSRLGSCLKSLKLDTVASSCTAMGVRSLRIMTGLLAAVSM